MKHRTHALTRREMLCSCANGFGGFALASLLQRDGVRADGPRKPPENLPLGLAARPPMFAPKANAMISLFMHGGPSHVDLLDPKPELNKLSGKPIPQSFIAGADEIIQ